MLDLAQWGVADPATLVFLDPPPAAALGEARALLADLGAIDGSGRITAEGKALNRLPLPPRLARMVFDAGREGAGRMARRHRRRAVASAASAAMTSILRHRLDSSAPRPLRRARRGPPHGEAVGGERAAGWRRRRAG